jgi:hypothetical protein
MSSKTSGFAAYVARIIEEEGNHVTVVTKPQNLREHKDLRGYTERAAWLQDTRQGHRPDPNLVAAKGQLTQAVAESGYQVTRLQESSNDMAIARMPYAASLATAEADCPAGMDAGRWRQAIEDARAFILRWGSDAQRLGWSAAELFGLHPTAPSCRYDEMGLIWLINGGEITELSQGQAAIQHPSGAILKFYRRRPKENSQTPTAQITK